MLGWLTPIKLDEDTVYSLDEARASHEVKEICSDGWLVLNRRDLWLDFAILQFHTSDVDDTNVLCTVVFYGDGPSGNLRECRHTYWGDQGYIFYPRGKIIMAAFKALSAFYDNLV